MSSVTRDGERLRGDSLCSPGLKDEGDWEDRWEIGPLGEGVLERERVWE